MEEIREGGHGESDTTQSWLMMSFWSDLALLPKCCKIPNINPGHIEDCKHFWWAYIWGLMFRELIFGGLLG